MMKIQSDYENSNIKQYPSQNIKMDAAIILDRNGLQIQDMECLYSYGYSNGVSLRNEITFQGTIRDFNFTLEI